MKLISCGNCAILLGEIDRLRAIVQALPRCETTEMIVHKLGIDAPVKGHLTLLNRLRRLKSTQRCTYVGPYTDEPSTCQIHIYTTMTENELDQWLYKTKGIDYIGVFKL